MKIRSLTALLTAVLMLFSACTAKSNSKEDTDSTNTTEDLTTVSLAEPTPQISAEGYLYESDSCKITAEMLQFIFFYDFYKSYAPYSEQYNLNIDLTFSEQICSATEEEGITWQQHLTYNTIEDIENAIFYIEDAAKNEYSYTTVNDSIDETFDQWESTAQDLGLTLDGYIKAFYGDNVTEDTARWSLQIIFCSTEYQSYLNESYESSIDDEDYENYYNANQKKLDIVDVIVYELPINFNGIINEDKCEMLVQSASEEEFKANIEAIERDMNSQLTNPKTEEALLLHIEESVKTIQSYYTEGGKFSEWAFAEEREAGDIMYTENNDGMYYIYYLKSTAYPYVKDTANFMHMYCSVAANGTDEGAREKAEGLYEQWKSGEMTEDSFEAMAMENNDDPEGYLYENALKSNITGEFYTWLFEEDRKEGDTAVVTTDYGGYHVVYYLGKGMPEWKLNAKEDMISENTTTVIEAIKAVTDISEINYDLFDLLPNILPEGARTYTTSNYSY